MLFLCERIPGAAGAMGEHLTHNGEEQKDLINTMSKEETIMVIRIKNNWRLHSLMHGQEIRKGKRHCAEGSTLA
jgi:hypothetical protein